MLENVKIAFENYCKIPDEEWEKFCSLFKKVELKKDDYFIKPNEESYKMAFVEKGLLRFYFTTEEGDEYNQSFEKEDDLMMSYWTVLHGGPSCLTAQALEKSFIWETDYREFEKLYESHRCWDVIGRKFAERYFIEKTWREMQLLLCDAKERYQGFCKKFPMLVGRVPQYHLATYLGVNPSTLNRIIKQLK